MPHFPDLAQIEAGKYAAVWSHPKYRVKAHGLKLWREQRRLFPTDVRTALDIGCGHGRLMAQWVEEGIDARGVDVVDVLDQEIRLAHGSRLIVTPIWDLVLDEPVDLGVAADVLEHLPRMAVDPALEAIARACRVFVCQNAEFPSNFLGYTLHLTLESAAWWTTRMEAIGGAVRQFPHVGDGKKHVLRWHTGA